MNVMYLELHAASGFSFLRGASLPEELAERAAALELPVLGLLDGDGFYGAPRFHLACRRAGVRPLLGVEVTLEDGARLPVLATSRGGYRSLCRLLSRMHLRGARPGEGKLLYAELDELPEVIALSGDEEGPLAQALAAGGLEAARARAGQLAASFGKGNFYIELQRHYRREQEERNQAVIGLARSLQLPLVATGGVRYATPAARPVLDVFTCLRLHTRLEQAGRKLSPNAQRFLTAPALMERRFCDLPEAIANTAAIAARCAFTLDDLGYQFPQPPVPEGHTPQSWLRERTWAGARRRYGTLRAQVRMQLEHELAIIGKLNLAGYFLVLDSIMGYCRTHGILAQGRGSAANSAVCYSLGVTAVDPIRMQLLFERFLSEERGEWPDIDLDLPSGELREQVIQYVYGQYGHGAAMTANVITYRPRSAAREAAKVMDFPEAAQARLAQVLSAADTMVGLPSWQETLKQRAPGARFPPAAADIAPPVAEGLRQAGFDPANPQLLRFLYVCQAMQDLPRHLGQHSGGMVLCAGPLSEIVPLQPAAMPRRVVIQWDKEDCAALGLIKVDLLGLGMMAVLKDCIELVPRHYKEPVDLACLPEDPAVYETLRKADTVGMFQVESRAQMASIPHNAPTRFYDLVVQVAIIRPGPIVGKMVHPYLKRRQGLETPEYYHPDLEPVLARTLGVPLFQEQLLRMAMIAAGFTGGEAEELRRAMGFKRSEARMREIEVKLRRGMASKGIVSETQDKIVQSITSFALYGFPESHAASFALIAYASGYLKCHYLAAFTAAMLNNQPMGFYSPATLVKDAQRHGLKCKPIDATRSDWKCTLEPVAEGFAVRLGMRYVKVLRKEVALEIVRQRGARKFASIEDLRRRVPSAQKSELAALAEIGALNFIGEKRGFHRRDALWQVERAARRPGPLLEEQSEIAEAEEFDAVKASEPNMRVHGIDEKSAAVSANDSPLLPMTTEERLVADFRGTGMTVGPHPMAYRRAEMKRQGIRAAADLEKLPDGTRVRYAGAVVCRQRPGTAKGFVFLSLEDETGIANAIVTPQLFAQDHTVVVHHPFLLIEGRLQNLDNVISIKAERIEPLAVTRVEMESHDFH